MTTVNDIEFIIPCAGPSTRNYPQSKGLPHKALLPFGSYRLIDHVLQDIFNCGGRNITIIVSNDEVIHAFKNALKDDNETREKLIAKGRRNIVDVLDSTKVPEDANIKYVIQEKALGTAQCLALAYEHSIDKHGLMIFPDDIYISKDKNNSNLKKLIDNFLANEKQILVQGIKREDVSNNAIIRNGRLLEKPKDPDTNIGGFSPIMIPKEAMRHIYSIMPSFVRKDKEWYYTDAVNDFLDNNEKGSEYELKMPVKEDEDNYMDVGTLPLYEEALLMSLLCLSYDKEKHIQRAKDLLDKIA